MVKCRQGKSLVGVGPDLVGGRVHHAPIEAGRKGPRLGPERVGLASVDDPGFPPVPNVRLLLVKNEQL